MALALPEEHGAISAADWPFLADQMETWAHAFPKRIPGWRSSEAPARGNLPFTLRWVSH